MTANIAFYNKEVHCNTVCWEVSARCNDHCRFCYRNMISKELDAYEAFHVLDRLAEGGVRKISFTGGEALL
ncbi:MAG: hypothetical protein GX117_11780, partial [Candidatus Hydrogenedentes bacterium]|nr:hypothetical protein [Candidatus Hydrogenedentota bacterium]